ncbi:prolipoprotein diacylglyceryl transferase [Marinilabiliaceae bacterium ANBcel2]|nr:prolipoprotein diacylglyceryl transferase [Marinilabiliaceae bacterium ANBcel2]
MILNYITWAPDPEFFSIGPLTVRYYGLFFALGFLIGYYLVDKMFRRENAPVEWVDKLFMYVMIATVVGARLGHVFFYAWDYYSQNLNEILMVWRGGLASHGGALGILIAIWIYSKKVTKRSMLWTLDRLVIPVALVAVFIRMGNLMNSEIIGSETSLSWGFIFLKAHIDNPEIPRHPSQIYEAIFYLITFIVLMYMYWKKAAAEREGLIFGVFLIGIFATRIFVEFFKEIQSGFEEQMFLNMGQILSIPFVILAIYLIIRALNKPRIKI